VGSASKKDPPSLAEVPAFQEVYRAELSWVLRTLRRLGIPDAEVEDVAHDLFVAVFRHFDAYDPARPRRPWLFGFAIRIARDHRALARHRVEIKGEHAEPPASGRGPDDAIDQERKRRLVLRVLDALDLDKRSLIVMHDLDGMTAPQIAEILGVPVNTVYSRIRLARAAFERYLRELGGAT
jgi:RNA polymerase sigma-70 factor (ECF subfamily)